MHWVSPAGYSTGEFHILLECLVSYLLQGSLMRVGITIIQVEQQMFHTGMHTFLQAQRFGVHKNLKCSHCIFLNYFRLWNLQDPITFVKLLKVSY